MKTDDSPFLQLPHMTKEILSRMDVRSGRDGFKEFIARDPGRRELGKFFTPEQTKEIESAIASYPKISLKLSCYVCGSEGIYEQDFLTIEVKIDITRAIDQDPTIKEDTTPFSVHSNTFPYSKQEILWLTIINNNDKTQFQSLKLNRKFSTATKKAVLFLPTVLNRLYYLK